MNKKSLLGATALRSFAGVGAVLAFASPAIAQQTKVDTPPPQALTTEQAIKSGTAPNCDSPNGPTPANCQAIVVTGSRIRRPNLESNLPVTSIGGQEFFETGNVSIGDTLNELPSLRSTFGQANSTRFLGTAGLNLLDLRGLGTVRTLVLVNGRRHVGGDVLNSGVGVDTNTIPADLVDRVDVVTGGNSAVYGSDAIAGVVNFVLKDHYQGFQIRGQAGLSRYHDAGAYFLSALAGTNFGDGRGNIALNVEYARQDDYFAQNRPFLSRQDAFLGVDSDPAGLPNGSDGIPDNIFFQDVRSATFNNTGLVRFGGNAALNCGRDANSGRFFNCPFMFTPTGQLVPLTGLRVGIGPNGSFIGGNGENFRGGRQFQLSPALNRYNINLIGHYEISPAFVPFIEAKFSRTDSSGTGSSGPAFISGTTLGDLRERPRLDNPFLDPAARTLIASNLLTAGFNPFTGAPLSAANMAAIADGSFRFPLRESFLNLPARTEDARRDTFRIVAGVKGDLGGSWNYEASVNYGRLKERTKILGNLDVQRFLLAADAGINPATGQIQCKSQFDPTRAFGIGIDETGPRLANDIAACTPVNLFGGQFTNAQANYLLLNTVATGKTSQFDATAFIAGDTGRFFNLPGGPIGVVVGAEYRVNDLYYNQDPEITAGYTFYNSIPTFKAPKEKVKEAFGELRLPIAKDIPFINNLEVNGAARVSRYSTGSTGTVYAYNYGAEYAPIRDLRFRGNIGRSVRAPNQAELFTPPGQNFAPGFVDPCSSQNLGLGTTNRAANCLAAGIPAGYFFQYNQSLELRSGGNPNLKAEKSDSLTLGGVFQPRFIPGFSLSVDYYNIRVKSTIQTLGAQAIANQCYDQPTLNNPFCGLFQRAGPAGGPNGEVPNQIIEGSLLSGPVNFAKLRVRGIDTEVAYRHQLGNLGRFDTRLQYTHVLTRSQYLDPGAPNFEDRVLSELGDPQDAFNWRSSLQTGRFTFGYTMRYIGKQTISTAESVYPVNGSPPNNTDFATTLFYPARTYHDVRLAIDATKRFNFYLGVDNLTNTKPPFGLTGIGSGSAIYDNRGRFYYTGIVAKF